MTLCLWYTVSQGAHQLQQIRTAGFLNIESKASSLMIPKTQRKDFFLAAAWQKNRLIYDSSNCGRKLHLSCTTAHIIVTRNQNPSKYRVYGMFVS